VNKRRNVLKAGTLYPVRVGSLPMLVHVALRNIVVCGGTVMLIPWRCLFVNPTTAVLAVLQTAERLETERHQYISRRLVTGNRKLIWRWWRWQQIRNLRLIVIDLPYSTCLYLHYIP